MLLPVDKQITGSFIMEFEVLTIGKFLVCPGGFPIISDELTGDESSVRISTRVSFPEAELCFHTTPSDHEKKKVRVSGRNHLQPYVL